MHNAEGPETTSEAPEQDVRLDRRDMLRRAGAVVAGAAAAGAGATAVGAINATPAQAAPGDPVVQGTTNNAGITATELTTSKADGASLALENTGKDLFGDGGPSLTLAPSQASYLSDTSPPGSMMLASDGMMMTAPPDGSGGAIHNHYLYDSFNSTFTVPVKVHRAVDTRYSKNDRDRFFNTTGKFDTAGRLIGGNTVHLDISDLVAYSWGVFVNVVTFSQQGNGWITVWPYGGSRPTPATVQFYTGHSVRNSTLTPVGWDDTRTDVLSIWASDTTHFTIDILGVVINHWASLEGSPMSSAMHAVKSGVGTQEESFARRQAGFAKKIAEWSKRNR